MSDITQHLKLQRIKTGLLLPGFALSAGVAGVALWAGNIPTLANAGMSALTLAILFGILVGNTLYPRLTG